MRLLFVLPPLLALACIGKPETTPAPPRDETASPASLSGRVVAPGELSAAELARSVVYLEPIGSALAPDSPPTISELHHRSARFAPDLVAVAPGDPLWLINDDTIFHGAFSYSRPNDFDLGVYGPGEHRVIHFAHPGPVRIHCPIHTEEGSVVVVVATRLVARPSASGVYEIMGAAPGRYWLKAWADGLPEVAYDVTLRPGEAAFRDIVLGSDRATSAASSGARVGTGRPTPRRPAAAPRPGSPGSGHSPTSPAGHAAP
jgi:plastocyanin